MALYNVNRFANDGGGQAFMQGAKSAGGARVPNMPAAAQPAAPTVTNGIADASNLPVSSIGAINRAPGLSMVENVTGNPNGTVYDQVMNGRPGYTPPAAAQPAAPTVQPATPGAGVAGSIDGNANAPAGGAAVPETVPGGGTNGYEAPILPGATDLTAYQEELYARQQEAKLAALERAYMAQMAALEKQAATVPQYYYEAGRQVAGQNAREQQAMNERFAAMGLNTGAAGQAALAQNAVYQGNIAGIKQAEANALAEIEADRTALALDYQAQIREAILNNESEKAAALYEEMLRQDEYMISNALAQAQLDMQAYQIQTEAADKELAQLEERAATMAALGDYSLYKYLGYSDEQIAALASAWQAKNAPKVYSGGGVVGTGGGTFAGGGGSQIGAMANPLTNAQAMQLYGAFVNGTMDPQSIGYALDANLAMGTITEAEADYILAQMGA